MNEDFVNKARVQSDWNTEYIDFNDINIHYKLKGNDKKKCKKYIFPEIEKLFKNKKTKSCSIRFANILIAHLLKAYRMHADALGIEIALDATSNKSIQQKGTRGLTDTTVRKVINYLLQKGYIIKINAHVEKVADEWLYKRSTLFKATDKLYKLITAEETTKICNACKEEKDVTNFTRQRNGYEATCKSCRAIARKIARANKR